MAAHERPVEQRATAPGPPATRSGAGLSAARVTALQRAAGNAAVARLLRARSMQARSPPPAGRALARAPAPPPGLTRDLTKLRIEPDAGATATIDLARRHVPATIRGFDYWSASTNVWLTWRWFDGSDHEVDSTKRLTGPKLFFDVGRVRKRVGTSGRSAIGTWTMRLEKGDHYDDVTFAVHEYEPLTPLAGSTNQAWFNVRDMPGGEVVGTLSGASVPITVDGKAQVGDDVFYHVTLGAATGSRRGDAGAFAAGSKVWLSGQAITTVAGWALFSAQLAAWEWANRALSLDARITRLRQMSHKSELPFDDVIGTSRATAPHTYLDHRPYKPGAWDILNDSQMVRMPDGKVVEIQHLLVGLDVLPRRKEDHAISIGWHELKVGQNYSAATWSGDVGAAAADAALAQDAEWHKRNPSASRAERTLRYYSTRLPVAELTADIDAWGIDATRSTILAPTTVLGLLVDYYGVPAVPDVPMPSGAMHTPKRKVAIERFLRHYGFKVGGSAPPLTSQTRPRDAMCVQVVLFGTTWLKYRGGLASLVSDLPTKLVADMTHYAIAMTDLMLSAVEQLARQTGATV